MAYLAGFIDGEGCFTLRGDKPRIKVSNTYPHVLAQLKAELGGTFYPEQTKRHPWRNSFQWWVTGDKAKEAVERLLPWLQEKRDQALLLLEARGKQGAALERIRKRLGEMKRIDYGQ